MYLVAIGELHGSAETATGPLAKDLGTTAYELRLLLNAGFPAVVLATVDQQLARTAVATVARHGHAPIACQRSEVVPSTRMTLLRNFEFAPDGVTAEKGASELLRYDDIAVILRAVHQTTTETSEEVKERKLRPLMAVATGGLVMSKTTKRQVLTRTEQREQALYLFRRSGQSPWLLRERSARYGGLGVELRPTGLENFTTTIRRFRELAPGAAYDERLMNCRPIRGVAQGVEATDLLAHLLALHLGARSYTHR
jgi:hypothetical protein